MNIQRVATQDTVALGSAATEVPQASRQAPPQTPDQLQPQRSACCIIGCVQRIWAYIVDFFRSLFGSAQIGEATTPITTSATAIEPRQSTRTAEQVPAQPAKPLITESMQQAQKELEQGIDVEAAIQQLKQVTPKIKNKEKDDEIVWHPSRNLIFSLKSVPNLVFKSALLCKGFFRNGQFYTAEQHIEHHFANMIKAKEKCTEHKLNLIVIPHAKKFKIDDMPFIAQERMDIQPDEAQEQLYKLPGLDEAIGQLATFIKETGFSDVVWRNIPLLDADSAFQGSRRIVLIDLEDMENASEGFYGSSNGSPGLIGCLFSEKQMDQVIAVAERHGISPGICSNPKEARMKKIQEDQALHAFYKEKGILDEPGKPIIVPDLAALELNLVEQETITIREVETQGNATITKKTAKQVTLQDVAKFVINEINKEIANKPYRGSVKAKRYIWLNHNNGILIKYNNLGLRDAPPPPQPLTREQQMQKWPWRTINALVKHGYLFKLDKENANGYFIQA